MRNLALIGLTVFVLGGCGQPVGNPPTITPSVPPKPTTRLVGPGGSVDIGDPIEAAKKAFPAPKGATIYDKSLSFAILGVDGWCWSVDSQSEAFEAAAKGGKIVALAITGGPLYKDPESTTSEVGEPTRKATGKTAEMYVWEEGDNARFWVHFKSAAPLLRLGTLTLVGNKNDLKLLNYQYDDPEVFVKQSDASWEMMNSPEVKKAFADAKEKAKAKVKAGK